MVCHLLPFAKVGQYNLLTLILLLAVVGLDLACPATFSENSVWKNSLRSWGDNKQKS